MSDAPASPLPPALVDAWTREIGFSRRGTPRWTVRSRNELCRALAAHPLPIAQALVRPLDGRASLAADGGVTMKFLRGGRLETVVVDPSTGRWQASETAGRNGLLGAASFVWRTDGGDVGPLGAADRFAMTLGLAALRSGAAR